MPARFPCTTSLRRPIASWFAFVRTKSCFENVFVTSTSTGSIVNAASVSLPEIATITRQVQKRGGKVYLDYVQNGHGRLLVAPFSARPLSGAPVSTPIDWKEVTSSLDIRAFTIRNVPERMKRLKGDPLLSVLGETPDLVQALARLQEQLDE